MTDLFTCTCPHCGQQMPSVQESSFADFWAKCPHKIGKKEAQGAWAKLKPADRAAALASVSVFYDWFAKTYKDASPLHPVRYLKHRRWEDEGIQPRAASNDDALGFYAKWINGDRFLPPTAIPTSTVSALIAAGMVTQDRARWRGLL